jgi:hypothetical protein
MRRITLLEVLDNPQRVNVVVEAPPMTLQAAVQRALTRMPKRRMADVVNQRQRLRQIFVQAKRGRNRPCNLRNLNSVRQAAAKMIGRPARKYLRLPRKPPEGSRLHNTLAVTLKRRAHGTQRRGIDAGQKKIARISSDRASMKIACHSQIQV